MEPIGLPAIDVTPTAARLGHGGGATTLWHYADPVSEVDRRAAAYLAQLTAHTATSKAAPAAGNRLGNGRARCGVDRPSVRGGAYDRSEG